jgi:hypothetical protein
MFQVALFGLLLVALLCARVAAYDCGPTVQPTFPAHGRHRRPRWDASALRRRSNYKGRHRAA